MTKEQTLALINSAIAGQGSAVDAGGALDKILTALAGASLGVEVEDMTKIDGAILDSLNVGDKIIKVTGNQKHLYFVTYKGEGAGEGIVITCNFCGYSEAISYDRSGEGWVFNSKDVKTYGE